MQQKRKYYQIQFWFIPKVMDNFGDLAHIQVEKYLRELFTSDMEKLLFISQKEVDEFFSKGFYVKRVYVSKEIHEKWKPLSRSIKKRLYYLINKKLLEVEA
jgi:tRNA(His) 5'-end guanylyltransferase